MRGSALLALAAAMPLLGACVIYDGTEGRDVSVTIGDRTTTASADPLETLRAVRYEPGALIVRVDSGGCTTKDDFEVGVSDGSPVDVTLTRKSPDLCKAFLADGVELSWTYADLGLEPGEGVTVRNPVRLP